VSPRLATHDAQLRRVFTDLDDGLHALRAAVAAHRGVRAATDKLIKLFDEVDAGCQSVLLAPPVG